MDKLAAEKIASEYYELGIKLAHSKIASGFQKAFQKTVNLGIGGIGGAAASEAYGQQLRNALSKNEYLKNVFAKADASDALSLAKRNISRMDDLDRDSLLGWLGSKGVTREEVLATIAKNKNILGESGMSGLEKAVDVAPGLALAGGVALPIYKGLGKLDRKLKLY